MDLDEIWHRGGPQGQKGSWGGTPTPRYKVHRGGTGGLLSLSRAFWQKLYQTKVAGLPQLSGNGSPLRTPNPNLEGPGLHVLLELWSLTFKDIFLKEKL